MTSIYRIGVINDVHGPYHCPRTLALALDIIEDIGADLWLDGDVFDFHNINRHKKKSPFLQTAFEDEIYWGNEFFADIRKRFILKGKRVKFIRGNHEEWLDEYLNNKAPAFWNLCQLEKIVNMDGVEIHPYNEAVQVDKTNLWVQHSPPSYAATGPMTSVKAKVDASHIWGCTHRMGHAALTGSTGKVYHGWFNGWMGSTTLTPDHFQVFKYAKGHQNWQHCFIIITVINHTEFYVTQHEIKNFSAVVDGFLYEG